MPIESAAARRTQCAMCIDVHRLVNSDHREIGDADSGNHFGEAPHAGLMPSIACGVSDRQIPGWINRSLAMA